MQTQDKLWTRMGMLGGAYAVLFVIAYALIGNEPGTGATRQAVLTYFHAHRAAQTAAVFVLALAVVALTFFLASLRHTLSRTDEGRYLANVVTAGGAVYAVGLTSMGALTIALVDAAHYHLAGAAQTLNVLANDTWVPMVVGLSLLGLGTGVSVIRSATLPKWLGWASVGLGILALAGPAGGIAFLLSPVWALVTGIVIFRRSNTAAVPSVPAAVGLSTTPA
jgi:hypothetical protein